MIKRALFVFFYVHVQLNVFIFKKKNEHWTVVLVMFYFQETRFSRNLNRFNLEVCDRNESPVKKIALRRSQSVPAKARSRRNDSPVVETSFSRNRRKPAPVGANPTQLEDRSFRSDPMRVDDEFLPQLGGGLSRATNRYWSFTLPLPHTVRDGAMSLTSRHSGQAWSRTAKRPQTTIWCLKSRGLYTGPLIVR